MKEVPVAPDVGARAAGYSPRRQYFSKAPGFMLPIARASEIVRQRKAKPTVLRVGEKRKVKPTRFRVTRNREANSLLGWAPEDESGIG
jgi:hypothetical protein